MNKLKNTSIYLEESQIRYLALMSVVSGLSKSQIIREMLDRDMEENEELVKEFQKILFQA